MNYFHPYPLLVDDSASIAWKSQLAEAENAPWLELTLAGRAGEFFPRFVTAYTNLRAMPRAARRSLQRRLARSRDMLEHAPEWLQRGEGRRLRYKLARSLAGAALLLALGQDVPAATITVTTNKPDVNDGDSQCSLIEAIINANNDAATHPDCPPGSGADTIELPPGSTHTLRGPFTNYHGYTGLPAITGAITIQGNGSKITRRKSRKLNRLIAVAATGDLSIENLTLSNGVEFYGGVIYNRGMLTITNATISGGISYFGAGLFNGAGGDATVESSTFAKNIALYGGGLQNRQGTVAVSNSTITGNKVIFDGGGIHNRAGTFTISNSTISKNKAGVNGAGAANYSGSFAIENSLVTGNKGKGFGGGLLIWNGTLAIENCIISNNETFAGGGIGSINFISLTISNSSISGNRSRYQGGGVSVGGIVMVENSTISGNKAGDIGGGFAHFQGSLTIDNSTISGNTTPTEGGGIWNQTHTTILSNTTIAANAANKGGGVFNAFSFGLGLFLERSLISGNTAPIGREIYNWISNGGKITVDVFNVIGTNGAAGNFGFTPGATDIVPGVPVSGILAPLANNGGPTMTHALVAGSPAIDAVPGADPACTGFDQRGTTRPQGAGCDIGAFEK